MTHAVKGSNLVSETEVNVFLEFPCVGSLISGSSACLNPAYKFEVLISHNAEAYLEGFWA